MGHFAVANSWCDTLRFLIAPHQPETIWLFDICSTAEQSHCQFREEKGFLVQKYNGIIDWYKYIDMD